VSHVGGDSLGGAERCLIEGAAGLRERAVDVVAVVPSNGLLADALRTAGASVVVLPNVWWARPGPIPPARRLRETASFLWHMPRALRGMTSLVKHEKPDLVVTNTLAAPIGAFAARRAGVPHLWYLHEFGREDQGYRFYFGERLAVALIDRLSRLVVVNSNAVRTKYEGKGLARKLRLVFNAVEMPDRLPRPAHRRAELELVLVGMLFPYKGQVDAIRAAGSLVASGIDVRLRLIGGGANEHYGNVLTSLVHDLHLEDRVDFVGFSDDPLKFVAAADVALMCSQNEAFGRVTVEAMKLGKPVVGARSGGTAELIEDGKTGLLYPPGDHEELARQIARLHGDEALRHELGTNARAWATTTFTRKRYVDDLLAAFSLAHEPAPDAT
jgi:glycosyltransferase involved in cell wall biosynthesis